MPAPAPRYWFKAKRIGRGWRPSTWQGWTFFVAWLAVIIAGAVWMRSSLPERLGLYFGFIAAMLAVMAGVCSWKGDPAGRWWGGRDRPPSD
jgi:hypothetical protein